MKAFLALALVGAGCAEGHAEVPVAGHTPDGAPIDFSVEASRPLLVDLTGDGVADLIVRSSSSGGYLAIDGASGRELWRSAPTKEHDAAAFAYLAGPRLIAVGRYVATVFDVATGAVVREVDLEGSPEMACEAPAGRARILEQDGGAFAFDIETGETLREPPDAPCTELRTDLSERREMIERHYRPVTFLPAGVPAIACGTWSVTHLGGGEGDGFTVADPCADLGLGHDSDVVRDFVPEAVVKTDRGALVLGHKRRGHPLPVLALVSDGKLVWSLTPEVDRDGTPDRLAFDRGEVAVLYNDSKATHLFSWEIATGKPILDVLVTSGAKWIDSGHDEWLVTGPSLALGVDEKNGELRPIVGDREAAQPSWSPGSAVPKGYVAETSATPDWKSVGAGIGLFGGTIALNGVLYGALGDKQLWPLLVPGVGPFIALGTISKPDQGIVTALGLDWAAQTIGIVWFSIGASERTTKIVPLRPKIGLGTVGVEGSF